MLFEPVLHDMFAGEIRKVFTDWNGNPRLEQSARTWHTSPTSANYLANIQPFL